LAGDSYVLSRSLGTEQPKSRFLLVDFSAATAQQQRLIIFFSIAFQQKS
jgi:hypothetical protein